MTNPFRKKLKSIETYKPTDMVKHKHNYCLKYLLIVTNVNEHATNNYYNKEEYYYVLKCDKCNSFIPNSVEGNYNCYIYNKKNIDNSLPIIRANTIQKSPHYNFSKLIDIIISNKG